MGSADMPRKLLSRLVSKHDSRSRDREHKSTCLGSTRIGGLVSMGLESRRLEVSSDKSGRRARRALHELNGTS